MPLCDCVITLVGTPTFDTKLLLETEMYQIYLRLVTNSLKTKKYGREDNIEVGHG